MNVTHFRPRRGGPEARLEDALLVEMPNLFPPRSGESQWVGGGVPIGAGLPDLVSVWYEPHVASLADLPMTDGRVLAYLRAVRQAHVTTIATRLRCSPRSIEGALDQLLNIDAVLLNGTDVYSLSTAWRNLLPEIVTIEAKVSNWRKAVQQAARNCLFANRSFVAMPSHVARRVRREIEFSTFGVGVIAVDDSGCAKIARKAPRCRKSVWTYYYMLAFLTARHSH